MKGLIATCTFAIVVAIIASPFLHSSYTRWRVENSKLEADVNDAEMAYAHCQNIYSMAGKTFQETEQLCEPLWDRLRSAKTKYKSDYWLDYLFSGR